MTLREHLECAKIWRTIHRPTAVYHLRQAKFMRGRKWALLDYE